MSFLKFHLRLRCSPRIEFYCKRCLSSEVVGKPETIQVLGNTYSTDKWTNLTPRLTTKLGAQLHNQHNHPLNLIKRRIQNYFYKTFINRTGNPEFSIYDQLSPIVTIHQNFDSLLFPDDHPGRSLTDSYYINKEYMLRAHTSAHQADLIKAGLDSFLVIGDVYRRDEIDATHYPAFHQCEGVRLFTSHRLFEKVKQRDAVSLFETGEQRDELKQACHTMETMKLVEHDLKNTLLGVTQYLFGEDIESRWVDTYFPFTHPSWELEIKYRDEWIEMLGCGIVEQDILNSCGAGSKVGWAFGLGLERLAMRLYDIPDIRLFWSQDEGFLSQFNVEDADTPIKYKPISQYSPCINDLAFWIPDGYVSNDFYDLLRSVAGDTVERVELIDVFTNSKTGRTSHCYRIVYRHMERTLTQKEVNVLHSQVEDAAKAGLGVEIR